MLLYCQFSSYFTFITKEKLMLEHMLMLVFYEADRVNV